MKTKTIDLNSDLGEGYNDKAIMPFISSCNIACGGHIGNIATIEKTVLLAKENKLAIGAHPSYPDKENFGRISIDISLPILLESVTKQTQLIIDSCSKNYCKLNQIKFHGALYNDMAKDEALSIAVLSVIQKIAPETIIYALAGSKTITAANTLGFKVKSEVFADRSYENKNELRSRSYSNAVYSDLTIIIKQVDEFLDHRLTDIYGNQHAILADTICLHSDTPTAVQIAQTISEHLSEKHVRISAT